MKWCLLLLALMLAGGAQARSWVVQPDGLGPYKVGARYENLGKTFGGLGPATKGSNPLCMVARSARYPGVQVTFVNKVVTRVDMTAGYASDRGVRIGDAAARLQRVYGESVRPQPEHPQWMTVETGDGALAIRYVLHEGRVAAIQAGKREQLQTAGGCD